VRDSLVNELIELKEIKETYLTFDSSNIPVKVKENNLKTSIKDRFSKNKKPKGDPASWLSINAGRAKTPKSCSYVKSL